MKHKSSLVLVSFVIIPIFLVIGCSNANEKTEDMIKNKTTNNEVVSMKLTSPDFSNNGPMPSELTCDGLGISPELNIEDAPKNAKSLVLINDDPDAPVGTWDHWIVFNIPPTTEKIPKGQEPQGIGGRNSWGRTGYGGPCPPSGTHRYFFKLYALDTTLSLKENASKKDIESAMKSHIISKAELMGAYKRR